jgi:hypothetical protein
MPEINQPAMVRPSMCGYPEADAPPL